MLKNCLQCAENFEITHEDLEFYNKVSTVIADKKYSLPPPTLCPDCRRQRRFASRNERSLYKRKCDLCEKSVISVFPEKSEYTVYCFECYYSDKWDALSYGKAYDFSKTFFEQFNALEKSFPHFALFQDGTSENCEYTNFGASNKSCYLMLGAYCEEVYYSHSILKSKCSMDCHKMLSCELCYECVDCNGCYNLFFSQDCNDSRDSYFLKDCRQCSDCFCSTGLRNAQFVFENTQLTKEEYKKRIQEMKFTNESIKEWEEKRDTLSQTIPKKYIHGISNENVTGDYVDNSKNLKNCFDCFAIEDCSYCDFCGMQSKDLYDSSYGGLGSELCYEVNGVTTFNRCKFIFYGRNLSDCEYSKYCTASENLFGCIGLAHKKYCILNKQYTKEEYEKIVSRIIESMGVAGRAHSASAETKRGSGSAGPSESEPTNKQYGEYFAIKDGIFAYNETVAYEYYPLKKEEALKKGYRWKEEEIQDKTARDEFTRDAISCTECGRNFRIIAQAAKLYQQWNFPIPEKCPQCRHAKRFNQRNPRQLWKRNCSQCKAEIVTSYAPDRPEKVACEKCYLKEMY